MGNCRLFTIILLLLFLNNSWNSVWSQVVTRFLNEMDTDEFPNPDNTSCKEAGCRGAGGYKFCNDCCKCRCNYGSYVSMNKRCVYDEDIAKGKIYIYKDLHLKRFISIKVYIYRYLYLNSLDEETEW